jgi:hypothetical protein
VRTPYAAALDPIFWLHQDRVSLDAIKMAVYASGNDQPVFDVQTMQQLFRSRCRRSAFRTCFMGLARAIR